MPVLLCQSARCHIPKKRSLSTALTSVMAKCSILRSSSSTRMQHVGLLRRRQPPTQFSQSSNWRPREKYAVYEETNGLEERFPRNKRLLPVDSVWEGAAVYPLSSWQLAMTARPHYVTGRIIILCTSNVVVVEGGLCNVISVSPCVT